MLELAIFRYRKYVYKEQKKRKEERKEEKWKKRERGMGKIDT